MLRVRVVVLILLVVSFLSVAPHTPRATAQMWPRLGDTLVWSPDGTRLAVAVESQIYIFTPDRRVTLVVPETALYFRDTHLIQLVISPDSRLIAALTIHRWEVVLCTVRIWDIVSGNLIATWDPVEFGATHINFSPDSTMLLLRGAYGGVMLWPVDSATQGAVWGDTRGSSSFGEPQILLNPAQTVLVSSALTTQQGTGVHFPRLEVYDPHTGDLLYSMRTQGHDFVSLMFDPRGNGRLVSLQSNGVVRFWDTSTGAQLFALTTRYNEADVIAYSPDGQTLATVAHDGTVRLWETDTGALLDVFQGAARWIHRLDYHADGTLIGYGHGETYTSVITWDVRTGEIVTTIDLSPIMPEPAASVANERV